MRRTVFTLAVHVGDTDFKIPVTGGPAPLRTQTAGPQITMALRQAPETVRSQ